MATAIAVVSDQDCDRASRGWENRPGRGWLDGAVYFGGRRPFTLSSTVLETPPRTTSVIETIRARGGGGPRRIAESAGVVITHGRGAHLYDDAGCEYLDFATAMGVAAIGHANPRWTAAIADQASRLAACVLHVPQQADYLAALGTILPGGLERTALYSGGAEAVEVAIRLAQSVTGNRDVISFTGGFHGKTTGVRFTGDRFASERRIRCAPDTMPSPTPRAPMPARRRWRRWRTTSHDSMAASRQSSSSPSSAPQATGLRSDCSCRACGDSAPIAAGS
jgi:4-aminobutyrate aminotransferase-like enzyme